MQLHLRCPGPHHQLPCPRLSRFRRHFPPRSGLLWPPSRPADLRYSHGLPGQLSLHQVFKCMCKCRCRCRQSRSRADGLLFALPLARHAGAAGSAGMAVKGPGSRVLHGLVSPTLAKRPTDWLAEPTCAKTTTDTCNLPSLACPSMRL